jgi:uncharacterized protein YecE (DUF72 family)
MKYDKKNFIGTSGWNYPHWKGSFYPSDVPQKKHNLEKLKTFLEALDSRKDNAVEFRHKDWWSKAVFDLFKENKISFCIVAGLGMPDDIIYTYKISYFRFLGDNYSSDYSGAAIKKYAGKISDFKGIKVYVYFNNDINAYAPRNALQLKRELGLKI